MGKSRGHASVPNRHAYSRVSFLYQAASLLASKDRVPPKPVARKASGAEFDHSAHSERQASVAAPVAAPAPASQNPVHSQQEILSSSNAVPRRLVAHMLDVARKSQIRLAPSIKQSVCMRCNVLLVPGTSSSSRMENNSKGSKKPWADILVIECTSCGAEKRFPVGAKRQRRRGPPRACRDGAGGAV